MLRITKGDDRYSGSYAECAMVYQQIMALGLPNWSNPEICTVSIVRALVKTLGLGKVVTVRNDRGHPVVRVPRYEHEEGLSSEEILRRWDEKQTATYHLRHVLEAYLPSGKTRFPDNPFQDGCYISLSVS